MQFMKLLAIALGLLVPVSAVQAATYKLDLFLGDPLDPFGDDIADASGTIEVTKFSTNSPDFAEEMTAAITLNGITFDLPSPQPFTFALNRSTLKLFQALLSAPYSQSPEPALWFSDFSWELRDCSTNGNGSFNCVPAQGRVLGGYALTPVPAPIPLPATALLLPVALGALVTLRRARNG